LKPHWKSENPFFAKMVSAPTCMLLNDQIVGKWTFIQQHDSSTESERKFVFSAILRDDHKIIPPSF
ncbi:MAG: hypothetical protein AAGK47_01050, partial [Bacteroidota bacterium]